MDEPGGMDREVPNPEDVILQEPGVIELKSGDIFMFIAPAKVCNMFHTQKTKVKPWSLPALVNIISPRFSCFHCKDTFNRRPVTGLE